MGSRGPKQKPIEILKQNGTYRPSRHGADIVQFTTVDEATPPEYLGEEGLRIWNIHYGELKKAGVLQVTDMESFGQLCLLHEKVKYADDICNEEGWVLTNDKGNRTRNPMAIQRADWVRELIQYKTRFGMFPSCRADLDTKSTRSSGVAVRQR